MTRLMTRDELVARVDELQAERDAYETAVAEVIETLGGDGSRPADLHAVVGALDGILSGDSLDGTTEYSGLLREVDALAFLLLGDLREEVGDRWGRLRASLVDRG